MCTYICVRAYIGLCVFIKMDVPVYVYMCTYMFVCVHIHMFSVKAIIFARSTRSSVQFVSFIVSVEYLRFLVFLDVKLFSFIRSTEFVIRNLGRLLIDMVLMYLLARLQWPCRRSWSNHQLIKPLLSDGYHPPFSTQWTSPSAIYSSSN